MLPWLSVFHGEAVAGEGVGGVGLQDFGEGGDLVHELMVRCERLVVGKFAMIGECSR